MFDGSATLSMRIFLSTNDSIAREGAVTITDAETIDIIATRPGSDLVKLVISDHLPWDDVHAHSHLVQTKINTCVAFVETGQLHRVKEPPIPDAPQICIVLAALHRPPPAAEEFLARVKEFLVSQGIQFEVDVRRAI